MQLSNLDRALAKAVDDCLATIKAALSECIYESFDLATLRAAAAAVPTATAWGARRAEGGMYWATYKATCRRSGVYTGASGPRDFNAELLEPISKQLANGWERAFLRRLPAALEAFSVDARLLLEAFHRDVVQHSEQRGTNHGGIGMLSQQLRTHVARLREIPGMLRTVIQDLQRDASRGFQPVVTAEMEPAYDACVQERGPGSYARMKTRMADHVETQRHGMFARATESVRAELEVLCERVEQGVRAQVLEIYGLLARDYMAVLVGAGSATTAVEEPGLSGGPEALLRAEMLPILDDAARWFADASGSSGGDCLFKDESSPVRGLSPAAGDGHAADDDDDGDFDELAATQLHEESEAGVYGRDSVGTTTGESAV